MIQYNFHDFFVEELSPPTIKKVDFLEEGLYPIIGQGKNVVEGFTNNPEYLYTGKLPCIIFGEHTKEVKFLNSQFAVAGTGVRILTTHNNNYTDFGYFFLKQLRFPNLGYSRYYRYLKEQMIPFPNEESFKYIRYLKILENLISKRNKAIELLDEYIKSTFLEMFGDPVLNPKGWKQSEIMDLVSNTKNSIKRGPFGSAIKKEDFEESGYLIYEQYHALNNDFSLERYFINEKKFQELIDFKVSAGDIIISCSGVNLGKLSVIPKIFREGIINQALLKITLDTNKMTQDFFVSLFTNDNFKMKNLSVRGVGVPNFPPMQEFKKFLFITPPLKIQEQYSEIVNQIQIQKQKFINSVALLKELFQSLQYNLFNKTEDKKGDEVDLFIADEFKVENLLESLDNGNDKSLQQYELEKDMLFKILERTEQRNKEDKNFLKGAVLKLDNDKIAVKTNKDDKFGL